MLKDKGKRSWTRFYKFQDNIALGRANNGAVVQAAVTYIFAKMVSFIIVRNSVVIQAFHYLNTHWKTSGANTIQRNIAHLIAQLPAFM